MLVPVQWERLWNHLLPDRTVRPFVSHLRLSHLLEQVGGGARVAGEMPAEQLDGGGREDEVGAGRAGAEVVVGDRGVWVGAACGTEQKRSRNGSGKKRSRNGQETACLRGDSAPTLMTDVVTPDPSSAQS